MSIGIHRLANGLRIVTEPMPGLHSAAVGIWVTAGGRNERIEQNGVALRGTDIRYHLLDRCRFVGNQVAIQADGVRTCPASRTSFHR